MPMQEDYYFGNEEELLSLSDEDLFNKHIIGDDLELGALNGAISDYFQSYSPMEHSGIAS